MLINQHEALTVAGVALGLDEVQLSPGNPRPDVIVLDVDPSNDFGFELIHDLMKMTGGAPVLVLASAHLVECESMALRFGAAGVVFREQTPQIFVKALERVSAGDCWFSRNMMTSLIHQAADSKVAAINRLTRRERQVCDLIAKALKNQEIAEQLSISEATVRHHLTSIFQKIGVSDRNQLIVYCYEHLRTSSKASSGS
jgi:DNA-binding NarL/FixJ family response regulator